MWRVEKAINNLNANAYGEGAKHSLDVCILSTLYSTGGYVMLTAIQDFKEVFGKRVRNGTEW